ncbi:hypothetical protein HGRIS_008424 [Hohenbuehelia grisea]|uniref:Plant basic secretory protein n=1 Tax=Hohenbuehelia grisea TaxID=104357 RepID=A0ABR3J8D0_9AGAR
MAPPPIPPHKPPHWPLPKFSLRVDDLEHPGTALFFDNVKPLDAMRDAVISCFQHLYTPETVPTHVHSIQLVLRQMPGVAHACGSRTAKEIHFSLSHIVNSASRARDEILGVLTHETVHCFQYDGSGNCPGGMIEGVADWVRLRAQLGAPHWKRSAGEKWDNGYERTAFFLDWIEGRYGDGTIRELNERVRDDYNERIFKETTGRKVAKLWRLYCESLET